MNLEERLERLRTVMGLTKQELYDKLEISRAMVSAVRTGSRQPGLKFLRRLEDMEREEGTLLQVGAAAAVNQKRGGDSKAFGILYEELRETGTRTHHVDVTAMPDMVLENMFRSIGEELKQAEEPIRTKLLWSLNLVHEELNYRERARAAGEEARPELILHEKKKPAPPSLPLTPEEAAKAKSYVDRIGAGDESGGSSKKRGAGGPRPRKAQLPRPSSSAPSVERPGSGDKGQR